MTRNELCRIACAVSAAFLIAAPSAVLAVGGPSGTQVNFQAQGKIGEVFVNPYRIAPLTAIIGNGGYELKDVSVRVVPKKGGQEIAYAVEDRICRTHGGIPVFGLYPEYLNEIEVKWTKKTIEGPVEKTETYRIWTPPVYLDPSWTHGRPVKTFDTKIVTPAAKGFGDRLYLINNLLPESPKGSRAVWNNPTGGALQWNNYPQNAIVDTKGEVRWYMQPSAIYDPRSLNKAGIMMGFHQNEDGALTWGYGQRYVKYDLMGREIFNRVLPDGYADFSHAMAPAPDGHYFLRVSSADLKRADGTHVHTVRDVIAEVDAAGRVVDDWRLFEILDPNRSIVIKSIDQGAVCLNIDASKAGKTLSEEDIRKLNESDHYGDIAGTGPGRNWAHVNSVDYDPDDDSIIISSRHQSAIIKIGRDKKVKWILASPEGWRGELAKKVLTPVDANGNKIKCEGSKCEGGFDWTWTQHTAFRIDSKSDKDVIYVSAFDNGDARGAEQPALPEMKYSRAVIYKIDQKKRTVEQVWEYGKERGHSWYSPVTSLTEYQADKDSVMMYFATAGAQYDLKTGAFNTAPNPTIFEFKWMAKEPSVEIQLLDCTGYQAWPFSIDKAMNATAQ